MDTLFEPILKQLGLSDKEAKIYLASLELGPSAVAQIAQKADINRPTTYVQIEKLMKLGLMSSYIKGKKQYFTVEPPERLEELIRIKKSEIEAQSNRLKKILPELQVVFDTAEERPKVRFYEGKEGIISMIREGFKAKNKELLNFYSFDFYKDFFTKSDREEFDKIRLKKKIKARSLYTRKEGPFKEPPPSTLDDRFVPAEKFPFSASIDIYDNKIAAHTMRGKIIGVVIESKEVADMMRSLFNLAWEAAEKYQKNR